MSMQLIDRSAGPSAPALIATSPGSSSFGPCDVRMPRDGLLLAVKSDRDAAVELTVHMSVPARLRAL